MLKLYICPQCKCFRYVSKDNITCYRCNEKMIKSPITYNEFISMNIDERTECLQNNCSSSN